MVVGTVMALLVVNVKKVRKRRRMDHAQVLADAETSRKSTKTCLSH